MKCDDCRVRSKALLVLRNVLSRLDANQISERECKLFSDFLQDLSVHAKDKEGFNKNHIQTAPNYKTFFVKLSKLFPVKRVFARIIGDIGEIAINFAKRCSDGENDEHYIELGKQI